MIEVLRDDENKDLETKERCEGERMADTRKAIIRSREIDEMTEIVMKLVADIAKLKAEIEGVEAQKKKVEEELEAATRIRDDEHAAWLVTDKDDKAAEEIVTNAKDVLENFYKENKLVLTQTERIPVVDAGEA